jgi:hypothetical protein
MFVQTVVGPNQKFTYQLMSFCPQCSVSLAIRARSEGALDTVVCNVIDDPVSSDIPKRVRDRRVGWTASA